MLIWVKFREMPGFSPIFTDFDTRFHNQRVGHYSQKIYKYVKSSYGCNWLIKNLLSIVPDLEKNENQGSLDFCFSNSESVVRLIFPLLTLIVQRQAICFWIMSKIYKCQDFMCKNKYFFWNILYIAANFLKLCMKIRRKISQIAGGGQTAWTIFYSDPLNHVFYLLGSGGSGSSKTAYGSSTSFSGLSKTRIL